MNEILQSSYISIGFKKELMRNLEDVFTMEVKYYSCHYGIIKLFFIVFSSGAQVR